MPDKLAQDIRIGTLVDGKGQDPASWIRQILPHGFESFSLTFWQTIGAVDLKALAARVREALGDSGAIISSLALFGNPLDTTPIDEESRQGWEALIDNAHLFGASVICGFAGRLRGKPVPESMPRYKQVFGELAKRAADKGLKLAFENCPMGGDWQRGDWNIAFNPDAWKLMFDALPADNIGLEWEPCHQMGQLIDPMAQLREWAPKFYHLHGKDGTLMWDVVKRYGITSAHAYHYHRTPGFGDCNWTDIITELRLAKFVGSIDIEGWHDPVYRGDLEMTGQVYGLNYLKRCRGDAYVANPV
jgi:sugar phosphate isomerase/epimerase